MGAPVWNQTSALVRKNFLYQKRRYAMNVCLVLTPVLVLGVAYILQVLGNRAEENKCGCMCLRCCVGFTCRDADKDTQCDFQNRGEKCVQHDTSKCGPQFSTGDQALFCPIKHPSSWPPIFLTRQYVRGQRVPWYKGFILLYTSDNETLAQEILGSQLDVLGDVQLGNLEAAQYFLDQSKNYGEQGELTLRGEMFRVLGLSLTTKHLYNWPVYIDKGLFTLGITGTFVSNQCKQVQSMSGLIQSSIGNLKDLLGSFGGGLGFESDRAVREDGVVCTKIVSSFRPSEEDLRRRLFCNWHGAGCPKEERMLYGEITRNFGSAWNLKDTSHKHFNVDMWLPVKSSIERTQVRAHMPQNFAANSFLKWVTGDNERSATLLGLQELPKPESKLIIEFSGLLGPVLFSWVVTLFVPITLAQITYEKEHGLEMMMTMMGLGNWTNLFVLYLFYYTIYVLYIFVFVITGSAIGWIFFTGNSYGVQILYYFVLGHTQLASSFAMGTFFKQARSATGFAYIWVIGNGLVANFLYILQAKKSNQLAAGIMELSPPIAVFRGMWEFGVYATYGEHRHSHGMIWESLLDDGNGLLRILIISAVEWPIFMLIAWMRSAGNNTFLELPSLKAVISWTKNHVVKKKLHSQDSNKEMAPALSRRRVRSDVLQDLDFEEGIGPDPWGNAPPGEFVVAARKLRKVFPAVAGGSPKVAVADLNLSVKSGEVFGLLGPNGAGKSTAISLMIGSQSPTDGTVYVDGLNILNDKYEIYNRMGVCAQDNHIWETLTGREHLAFYGQLKGIPPNKLQAAVDSALAAVGLLGWGVGDKRVGKYSGGMKRRLCVAIALIGKPKAVYLDEPSTGMDLYSRRMLWAAVRDARKDCGIVLTTHSMEEAEALCDRIGFFVAGKLVCLGSPKELKSKFGGYMVLTLMVQPEMIGDAQNTIGQIWPHARLLYSHGGVLKFKLGAEIKASEVFSVMQVTMSKQVHDWSITHASLEEIFIMVVRNIVGFDALQ